MSKDQIEKQAIEEMAKVIERTEQIARDAHCGLPSPTMYAKDLYWHGYRKQSEVENYKQVAEYQQKLAMDRYFEIKRLEEELATAKAEVAREIFAEIDELIKDYAHNHLDAAELVVKLFLLKKKYTEEKT